MARITGARTTADRAGLILAQNSDTARRLSRPDRTTVLPNALIVLDAAAPRRVPASHPPYRVVTGGRLIGWKATKLAVSTIQWLPEPFCLEVYRDGPERSHLQRFAERKRLTDRVTLFGAYPRAEYQAAVAGAAAYLHTALHDEAPFTVAEALASGVPTVVLDRGGPPEIVRRVHGVPSTVVTPSTPKGTAQRLASAILRVVDAPPGGRPTVSPTFSDQLLAAYRDIYRREARH